MASQTYKLLSIFLQLFFFVILPRGNCISFDFTSFQPNMREIQFQGDAFASANVLQLTKNQADAPLTNSTGRASYSQSVRLWDSASGNLTNFSTRFSFRITSPTSSSRSPYNADGLTFFIAPCGSNIPPLSHGGYLGLFSPDSAFNSSASNPVVAVEFDTFSNEWDPSFQHMGININSVVSNNTVAVTRMSVSTAYAVVSYDSNTKELLSNLSILDTVTGRYEDYAVSATVDLREVLPEWVTVGFSAGTGMWVEIHNILSWNFSSSLEY